MGDVSHWLMGIKIWPPCLGGGGFLLPETRHHCQFNTICSSSPPPTQPASSKQVKMAAPGGCRRFNLAHLSLWEDFSASASLNRRSLSPALKREEETPLQPRASCVSQLEGRDGKNHGASPPQKRSRQLCRC
ncbi:hypothetical protein NQZ68_023697 [Dissostichus eleginoides]|nr:hypothetical protein NQZ68_023697 [Dissostichus eleginoides]